MTQLGEAVSFALINEQIRKCPFTVPDAEDAEEEDESFAKDDSITMRAAQENSGSKLGNNVEEGSPGKPGTWNVLGGDPERYKAKQVDTNRTGDKVNVSGRKYPYTVAAHHLIPGNASLYESQLFKSYMRRNGKMEVDTPTQMTFTVSHHIGYNVNGSHNGVWLPGSYAIRESVHESGLTWSVLIGHPDHADWCHEYMAVVAKKADGQFHDAHTNYNENALKVLEKLTVKLVKHQVTCDECKGKDKVPPPYGIKAKLYRLSRFLRVQVTARPRRWKTSWMTSDQVRTDIMANPVRKKEFLETYDAS